MKLSSFFALLTFISIISMVIVGHKNYDSEDSDMKCTWLFMGSMVLSIILFCVALTIKFIYD